MSTKETTIPSVIRLLIEGPWIFSNDNQGNLVATTFGDLKTGMKGMSILHVCQVGLWNGLMAPIPNSGSTSPLNLNKGEVWTVTMNRGANTNSFDDVVGAALTAGTVPGVYFPVSSPSVDFTKGSDRRIILPMPDAVFFGGQLTKTSVVNSAKPTAAMHPFVTAILEYNNPLRTILTVNSNLKGGPSGLQITGALDIVFRLTYSADEEMAGMTPQDHIQDGFAELLSRLTGSIEVASYLIDCTDDSTDLTAVRGCGPYEMGTMPLPKVVKGIDTPNCPGGGLGIGN